MVEQVYHELARAFDPEPANILPTDSHPPRNTPNARAERLCAVGGFRRAKAEMKDLELLFIPRIVEKVDPMDMFGARHAVNDTETVICELLRSGVIEPRLTEKGCKVWGDWNKLARHVATGLPIDLFTATAENYFNRLVVTTGPKEVNILIASRAHERGYDWKVNEAGFVPRGEEWDGSKMRRTMRSEREVFEFVGLPLLNPSERTAAALERLAA